MHMLGRGFHTLIKGASFSFPTEWDLTIHPVREPASSLTLISFSNRCGTHQIYPPSRLNILTGTSTHVHPLRGSASLLAHRPVSGSNVICYNSSPPLADMVLFGFFLSGFSFKDFKTRVLGKSFHTLIIRVFHTFTCFILKIFIELYPVKALSVPF